MFYCFKRDVVATRCFPLKKTLSVYILTTSGCFPIFLVLILVSHETEDISTHPIIKQIGPVLVLPTVNELISQRVNKKPSYGHFPFSLPSAHHSTKRHQVSVADCIATANGFYFGSWICSSPLSTVIGVRICIASGLIVEDGNNLERDAIREADDYHLAIRAKA